MPKIDQRLIDETWQRIRRYDTGTAVAEAQRFAREQPAVLRFTREFLREFDEGAQGTALGLVYLLFQVVEAARREPLPSLSPRQIEEGYAINAEWLDALDRIESGPPERWQDHLPRSPAALYILQAYSPPQEKKGLLNSRVKAHLLILLKTLLEALEEGEERQGPMEER
ncbi:MAG: hypothetical protein ACE5I9_08130 [Candidatus Methylomirabilales bacterium]